MIELLNIGFLKITIFDIIDILLVTILFYYLYRALKNTVALQILFGMVIIIALSFLTGAINLKALNWILQTISDIWVLAFIVLFQPELRKLLLMITRSPVFQIFVKTKISETIDEVVDATMELSEKHIGALIVFTRTQDVRMTIDTGIKLQAVVTRELLMSIFNTKAPLHDGAVIIDNQMATAARCVLPLSTTTKIGRKNLGTRHRAALGLTEQVDAVVLIVSEETGWISIAEKGDLILNIKQEDLKKVLVDKLSQ